MNTLSTANPKINRADVLRLAWQMVRSTTLSFGEASKKAWATLRLKAQMSMKPVGFYYIKEDGTKRFAIGLLSTNSNQPASPLVVRYYDTVANAPRSFRADRLILS